MRLGEALPGDDQIHFNGPSAIIVAPDGDFWVADGHRGVITESLNFRRVSFYFN